MTLLKVLKTCSCPADLCNDNWADAGFEESSSTSSGTSEKTTHKSSTAPDSRLKVAWL